MNETISKFTLSDISTYQNSEKFYILHVLTLPTNTVSKKDQRDLFCKCTSDVPFGLRNVCRCVSRQEMQTKYEYVRKISPSNNQNNVQKGMYNYTWPYNLPDKVCIYRQFTN